MNPIMTLPATCELCQYVMPSHSSSCPRNGVHPSQWGLAIDEITNSSAEQQVFFAVSNDCCFKWDNDDDKQQQETIHMENASCCY